MRTIVDEATRIGSSAELDALMTASGDSFEADAA